MLHEWTSGTKIVSIDSGVEVDASQRVTNSIRVDPVPSPAKSVGQNCVDLLDKIVDLPPFASSPLNDSINVVVFHYLEVKKGGSPPYCLRHPLHQRSSNVQFRTSMYGNWSLMSHRLTSTYDVTPNV